MAIVNRDLDPTQQRYVFTTLPIPIGISVLANATSISQIQTIAIAPCGSQLLQVATSAFGLSGTPSVGIQVQRFVVGKGLTTIALNGSSLLTISAYSTSGVQVHTLPAAGNTLVLLQSGDHVQLITSTANTSAAYGVEAVLQILQDVKSDYGV